MAFTRAVGDSSISKEIAVGSLTATRPTTALTARTQSPQAQLGRSNLRFNPTENIRSTGTRANPELPSSSNPRISGRQGQGNSIAAAIGATAEKLGVALAKQQAPLPTGVPGMTTSNIPAATSFIFPVTDAIGFTSPPRTSDFTAYYPFCFVWDYPTHNS